MHAVMIYRSNASMIKQKKNLPTAGGSLIFHRLFILSGTVTHWILYLGLRSQHSLVTCSQVLAPPAQRVRPFFVQ